MKIVHAAIATPGRCGLYETTRELVAAEREQGVDARIFDPKPHETYGIAGEDRGVPILSAGWALDMIWAESADIVISHSGIDGTPLADTDQPVLCAMHGRPYSTFLGERHGKTPVVSYQVERSADPRYIGAVTFWREHVKHHEVLWGDKPVYYVPACVDLDYWRPGPTGYDFAGKAGEINVVMTDPWARTDASPYDCVNAFILFQRDHPEARLHMYAYDGNLKGFSALFRRMTGGTVHGWAKDLRQVYRAADLLITPHRIATRSVREATACNVPVVSGYNVPAHDLEAFAGCMTNAMAADYSVISPRVLAETLHDPESSATEMLNVCETALSEAVI